MTDPVLLDVSEGLARVTLNRPAVLNAVDFAMGARWREVCQAVTSDPAVVAVLLTRRARPSVPAATCSPWPVVAARVRSWPRWPG